MELNSYTNMVISLSEVSHLCQYCSSLMLNGTGKAVWKPSHNYDTILTVELTCMADLREGDILIHT